MTAHRRALLLATALTAEAVVVDTTAALRAAVDRQEATIRLGADLSLGGEPLTITADCDLRGNGHALFQGPGARHMHVNGTVALAITDMTLALVGAVGLRPEGTNGSNYTWPTAGGIEIRDGNLTARDVSFEGLSARDQGGAVYALDGHTILRRCRFEGTGAGVAGGAAFQEGGALLVEDCNFTRTRAVVNGGAVAADRATLTIHRSTFVEAAVTGGSFSPGLFRPARGDRAPPAGGGAVWFMCTENSFTVADSRFVCCSVGPGAAGGAVRAQSRAQRFTNTLFEANTASPRPIAQSRSAAVWLAGTRSDSDAVEDPIELDDQALNDDEELNAFFGGTLVIRGCRFHDNYGRHEILAVKSFEVFKFIDTMVVGNDGAFILYLSRVVDSYFSHAAFEYNTGLVIRAYQLFAPAITNKDGAFVLTYSNFSHNHAPYSDDGGALFVKESPGQPIKINRVRFINNSAPISKGGALSLQAHAVMFLTLFENNSAYEGGAIYMGEDGALTSTWNDFVGNEAVVAGGAISACATQLDTTCTGTIASGGYDVPSINIVGTIASGNRVHEPDAERSGGGFLKSNGADMQLREVTFGDSTAAGRPSAIGLRFGNHQMHDVTLQDNGTILLANDGVLEIFCSPGTEGQLKKFDEDFSGWAVYNHPHECSLCDAGEEWAGPKSICVPCEPGTFKPPDQPHGATCEKCRGSRSYQRNAGQPTCDRCPKTKKANHRHTRCVKTGEELFLVETIVGIIGGLMGLAIIFLLVKKGRKEYLEKRKLEAERAVVVRQQVAEALSRVREFRSQLCVLAGDVFVELGELVSHEELLDRGHVIIVPTVARLNRAKNSGDVFVFISHQWLDFETPDPENIHYDAMVSVVRAVAEDAMTSLDRIRVWVDYVSIPQENRFTQRAAISSLPTFASSCDYFVVVAPEATHHGACTPCSSRTYRRRAWCRAEIMSCWARNGSNDMYFWSGSRGLKPLTGESGDEILLEALDVFNGDLTCCRLKHPHGDPCDREELMLPMLGLFAELYRGRDSTTRDAYALVEPLVDRLYPRTFTYRRDGHADEEHPLFGDLVDAVRHAIDTEADARSSGDGSPLGSFDGRNYFPGTHARRHARTRHGAGSLSSFPSRTSLRLPSLLSRRGSSKRRLTSESPATTQKAMSENSTSGTNSGTGGLSDSRASRKLVNFRTLTWQSSQGESKEDSGPPTF